LTANVDMKYPKTKTMREYFNELMSEECYCGRAKRPQYSFCYTCYKRLPRHLQLDLYSRMGAGYGEAYEAAVKYLSN
jgi:hypothetical protein